jgi:pimeloyl-ACP methyl ester carboxylesterase
MREDVVEFGPGNAMLGIITAPADDVSGTRRALLTTNVGMHHRVGPFRLYVDLARAVARAGWWALRFDQQGMGDSAPRSNASTNPAVESQDLIDAMDFLQQKFNVGEFTIVALCSGVDSAHIAALRDTRVRSAVFIDGYTYTTPAFFVRRYVKRGLQLGRWQRWLRRRARSGFLTAATPTYRQPSLFDRTYPAREQFRQDIRALASRGVRMRFIFTGTVDQNFNAERQMFEILGSGVPRSCISVSRLQHADHVFTSTSARASLIREICTWISEGA